MSFVINLTKENREWSWLHSSSHLASMWTISLQDATIRSMTRQDEPSSIRYQIKWQVLSGAVALKGVEPVIDHTSLAHIPKSYSQNGRDLKLYGSDSDIPDHFFNCVIVWIQTSVKPRKKWKVAVSILRPCVKRLWSTCMSSEDKQCAIWKDKLMLSTFQHNFADDAAAFVDSLDQFLFILAV